MKKLDLSKEYKRYYSAKMQPELFEIEPVRYISITGKGDPNGPLFAEHLATLYPVAYGLKFHSKALGKDFVVPKLEALWDFDEEKYGGVSMEDAPKKIPRSEWNYRLLIRLPDFIKDETVERIKEEIYARKQVSPVRNVELFKTPAKKVVQMLHTGPFEKEIETLTVLKEYIDKHGFGKGGPHHEIYLTDYRKTAREKLRTILRETVI
ncbi:hypothetical protein D3C87_65630 [compost metagenome]